MMKLKSDLSKTEHKERVSKYGIYYAKITKSENFSSYLRLYIQKKNNDEYHALQRVAFQTYEITNYDKTPPWPSREFECKYDILLPYLTMSRIIKERTFRKFFYEIIDNKINIRNDKIISDFLYAHCEFMNDYNLLIKEFLGMELVFEDIEETQNMEFRERALKRFGYERYIEEGLKEKKIRRIIIDNEILLGSELEYYDGSSPDQFKIEAIIKHTKEECIIFMYNEISFLKVRDSSTNKTYFLKIPPDIADIKEAKAWTFGLNKLQYNPMIET